MTTNAISPQRLVDTFMSYSPEQRDEFVRLFAQVCPHETPRAIIRQFPVEKFEEMMGEMYKKIFPRVLPICYRLAWERMKQNPEIGEAEFQTSMQEGFEKFLKDATLLAARKEKERLESQRNRKSDPEIIKRNAAICKRKNEKPELTNGQLANIFKPLSVSSVRDILEDKNKWLSLADKLP